MEITASMVKNLRDISGAGMMDCKKALSESNGNIDEAINYLREKGIAKSAKKEARIAAEGLANVLVKGNKAIILEINSETDFVSKNEEFIEMIKNIANTLIESNASSVEEALKVPFANETIGDYVISKIAKIGEKLSLRRFEIITKNDDEYFGDYIHMGGKIAVLTVVQGSNEEVAKDVAMQAAAMKPEYLCEEEVPDEVIENERKVQKELTMNEGKPEDIAEKMVEGRIKKFFKEICLVNQIFIKDNSLSIEKYVSNNGGKVIKMVRYEVGEGMEKRNDNFAEEVMNQINGN